MTIAGHTFDSRGYCSCGRKWLDIRHCTMEHRNEHGWAHFGILTQTEVEQIMARRAVEDAVFDAVLHDGGVGD